MATQNGSVGLYVHELHCTNIKKLRHVAVKLQPGVNRVVGENAQGKSTFLDLVKWAIGGAKEMPGEVITRGEERAQIILKFGEFTVERRFTKNEKGGEDSTLVLIGPDGGRLPKPQTVLEAFYDKYCFDPREFMSMVPLEQLDVMKRLGNLSFGPLEAKRASLYEERTDVNRKGGDLKARFQAMPTPPAELPAEPVDVDALLRRQNELRTVERKNDQARAELRQLQRHVETATRAVEQQRSRIDDLERQLEAEKTALLSCAETLQGATNAYNAQQEVVAQLVDPEIGDLTAKISAAQTTNLWLDRKKTRDATEKELEQLRLKREELTAAIEQLDKQKADAIAAVKFPVDGLTLGDAGPIYNGFALSEASAAEQLRVSVAIGIALNPKLRLMLVRDAALMGTAQLELLKQLAAEHQAQLLVEIAARDAKDLEVLIQEGDVVVVDGDAKVKGAQQLELGGAA
jgi:energy-coupling factor transporter ATP-binding protein EcfA2